MDWIRAARERLHELRGRSPGWGYRTKTEPFVEPTVLACLAVLATDPPANVGAAPESLATARNACEWLAALQQPKGSVGLAASLPEPSWPTAYAMLLWSAVDGMQAQSPRYAAAFTKAADYLLTFPGKLIARDEVGTVGHDGLIPGWAWVENTHPWVEPTSIAILALGKKNLGRSRRAEDGRRLLRDRALAKGGWNYGNTFVLGTELRPQPAPTALALLGLVGDDAKSPAIKNGLHYLERELPTIRAAPSLGGGLLALAAWGRRPNDAERWLAEAYPGARTRSDAAYQLAYLLLAARPAETLRLLGVAPVSGEKKR